MVKAVTIATTHQGKEVVVLGPEKSLVEHKAAFKAIRGDREHPKYAEVHVLVSSGTGFRQRFLKPGEKSKRLPVSIEPGTEAADPGEPSAPAEPPALQLDPVEP